MTKQQAHAILNAAKAGFNASEHVITLALMATGDLDDAKPRVAKRQFYDAVPSFLNRSGRVMRGAGEVVA